MEFLGGVREVRAGVHHVPFLMTSETKSLLETFLSLFWGEFLDFHNINVHSIGVSGYSRGGGEGLESLGRPSTLLGDLFHAVPLVLKMDCFEVPVIDLL